VPVIALFCIIADLAISTFLSARLPIADLALVIFCFLVLDSRFCPITNHKIYDH